MNDGWMVGLLYILWRGWASRSASLRIGNAGICAKVIDEILIRLLRSPIGGRVAQIGLTQSSMQRIAKAVAWVHANFSEPMNVEALAELVDMSVSSFHQHFKSVTSMSRLQYQKVLRLQDARRLMM
jgi:transcriptional regulator GlxA family with amidase domain